MTQRSFNIRKRKVLVLCFLTILVDIQGISAEKRQYKEQKNEADRYNKLQDKVDALRVESIAIQLFYLEKELIKLLEEQKKSVTFACIELTRSFIPIGWVRGDRIAKAGRGNFWAWGGKDPARENHKEVSHFAKNHPPKREGFG